MQKELNKFLNLTKLSKKFVTNLAVKFTIIFGGKVLYSMVCCHDKTRLLCPIEFIYNHHLNLIRVRGYRLKWFKRRFQVNIPGFLSKMSIGKLFLLIQVKISHVESSSSTEYVFHRMGHNLNLDNDSTIFAEVLIFLLQNAKALT